MTSGSGLCLSFANAFPVPPNHLTTVLSLHAVNALKNGITKATKEIEELVPEIARIAEELSHLTLQPAKRCVSI